MARRLQSCAKKGSKRWLQLAVNEYPNVFCIRIAQQLRPKPSFICLSSPVRGDEYAEYVGRDFTDRLGLKLESRSLDSFWPKRGPNRDGLARTDAAQVLLVEAKAHIGEMKEGGSTASSYKSIELIASSLKETQQFLGAKQSVDWSKSPYYQYANRLAHLYLLAELNGIDAYLLMVYFLNDVDIGGPNSSDLWEDAIRNQHKDMCLRQDHQLSDRIVNLYLDVRELGG